MARSFSQIAVTLFAAAAIATSTAASADTDEATQPSPWYERAADRAKDTWNHGETEFYVPLIIHHLRSAYTQEKIDSFNETPWGLGIGKGTYDEDGDWHGLYVMEFKDSHYKPEYIGGYGYKTYWPLYGDLKFGLGYTAFVTARSDIGHYTPIPFALPLLSLEYRKFAFDGIFLPGGHNKGNLFIFWGKIRF